MTVIWLKFRTKLSLCRSQATYFQVNVFSLLYRHSPVDFCLTWYVWKVSCCDLIQWHRHIKLIHCCQRRHLSLFLMLASWCRLHPGCRMPKMWWLMNYSFTDFLARVKTRHLAVCLSNKEYNTRWNKEWNDNFVCTALSTDLRLLFSISHVLFFVILSIAGVFAMWLRFVSFYLFIFESDHLDKLKFSFFTLKFVKTSSACLMCARTERKQVRIWCAWTHGTIAFECTHL